MAVLDIYERDGLIERARELEGPLADALAPLADHPAVAEVRAGLGLLAAVQLVAGGARARAGAVAKVAQGAREAGVLVRPLLGAVAMSPPLTVEQEHIDLLAEAIRHGLDSLDSAPAADPRRRLTRRRDVAPLSSTSSGRRAAAIAATSSGVRAGSGACSSARATSPRTDLT